jgi:hypothetical protein
MTPEELTAFRQGVDEHHDRFAQQMGNIQSASSDVISTDIESDALAEALFLRLFTAYERNVEFLFYHYVTGGLSAQGNPAPSYLNSRDEQVARRMVRGALRFVNWAKPDAIRETALTYIDRGWPIADMMSAQSQELADCERIRNRIAHNSPESVLQFNVVQRNLFATERLFDITPGQLLRVRHKKHQEIHLSRYATVMKLAIESMIDPS